MIALIIKELRCYVYQLRYRRIQFVILCLLAVTLFAAAFELFAISQKQPQIHVGESVFAILVPVFFIALICLAVPFLAIEAFRIEWQNDNWDLLKLTPLGSWRVLAGKLIGAIIATLWVVWLAVPLFWLSTYTGGLAIRQLLQCGFVFIAAFTLFFLIGIGLTLLGSPMTAMSRSYALVLSIIFIPLIISQVPASLLNLPPLFLDLLRMLSPLCSLIAIIKSETHVSMGLAPIWLWMIWCYTILSALLFWTSGRLLARYDSFGDA